MKRTPLIIAGIMFLAARLGCAATIVYCPFDSFEGWSVRTVGASAAEVVEKSKGTRCAEVASHRGSVFLSRELPLAEVRGCEVTVTCSVKSERIVRGPQTSSTGKVLLSIQTPRGIQRHYARFVGTKDWHQQGITADVPEDAQRVLLNLGLESCYGRAWFDRLIVRNDRRGVHRLNLAPIANAAHEQLKLDAFPKDALEWEDVSFAIIDGSKNNGLDCFRLKGIGHPDWPAGTSSPVAVNTCASAIYFLHGALGGRGTSESPGAIWTATFVGGQTSGFSVFEGREIGPIGSTEDLENWFVAWRGESVNEDRKAPTTHHPPPTTTPPTFGVTKWIIYSDLPIETLSCRAYRGAVPVVLAITVVEDAPATEDEQGDFNDAGGGFQ